MFIETHCHLDMLKDKPLSEVLSESFAEKIDSIITISVEPKNLDQVVELTNLSPKVFGTQGIHPHEARLFDQETEDKIRINAIKESKVLAIGEIGLDYHYDQSPREIQRQVFERQLEIAIELNLPVVIHSRDAEEDTKAILKNFANNMPKKGVIHSFTSKLDLAEVAIDLGFHLGFNGIITFKKADNVRQALEITPTEKIIFETDAPFLTPAPHRGKENAPYYLPYVAKKAAEIKQMSEEELFPLVYQNSLDLFQIPLHQAG